MSDPDRRRTGSGVLLLFLLLLLLAAAGPLVAGSLPAGPGALLSPGPASVGAAGLAILWIVFVWPLTARERSLRVVVTEGALLVLISAPFVAGLGHLSGAQGAMILSALGVVAATAVTTGAYLAGPGRRIVRDRFFVAGAVCLIVAMPLAAYALAEFSGSTSPLGFRLSPLFLVRRLLLEMPRTDPVPYLAVALAVAAVLGGGSALRRGAGVILLLAAASLAHGAEARPLFGDAYVPGRALPLLVSSDGSDPRIRVEIPGAAVVTAPRRAGGTLVFVPAPSPLANVRVDGQATAVELTAVDANGRLVVALGTPSEQVRQWALERGVVLTRAEPGAEDAPPLAFLAADGVLDPGGLLGAGTVAILERGGVTVLREADEASLDRLRERSRLIRRIWEEEGDVLMPDDLGAVFARAPAYDLGHAKSLFLILLGFAVLVAVVIRFRGPTMVAVLAVGFLAVVSWPLLRRVVPEVPAVRTATFRVRAPGRTVEVFRLEGRRRGVATLNLGSVPLPLGTGDPVRADWDDDGSCRVSVPVEARRVRYIATVGLSDASPAGAEFDVVFGPDGLARPGEPAMAPTGFLRKSFRVPGGGPSERGFALRKFLRLADLPSFDVGVRLPTADRPGMDLIPLE